MFYFYKTIIEVAPSIGHETLNKACFINPELEPEPEGNLHFESRTKTRNKLVFSVNPIPEPVLEPASLFSPEHESLSETKTLGWNLK